MTKKSVNCYFDQTVILGISLRNTIKLCSKNTDITMTEKISEMLF